MCFKYIGAELSDSLEPVARSSDEASLCLFYRYCFGKWLTEIGKLDPLSVTRSLSTCYFGRQH